jgi:hypothetical protein
LLDSDSSASDIIAVRWVSHCTAQLQREWLETYLFTNWLPKMTSYDSTTRSKSVVDAIKDGLWDFEPNCQDENEFDSTEAMPGTTEKLQVLATRIRAGLPLWHPSDRRSYDNSEGID